MTPDAKPTKLTFIWRIENFVGTLRCLDGNWIWSPTFITKIPFLAGWNLELFKDGASGGNVSIRLNTHSVSCPPRIFIDYEISVYGREDKPFVTERGHNKNISDVGIGLGTIKVSQMYDLERFAGENCVIQCEITIRSHESSEKEKELLALSADLLRLLDTGELSDLELRCEDRTFPVHKFLLSSRADLLAKHIGISPFDKSTPPVVEVRDIRSDVLQELISFLYSGRVTTRDQQVLIQLEQIAEKFKISDLGEILFPSVKTYVACTKLRMESLRFRWPIRSFESMQSNVRLAHPPISALTRNCKLIASVEKSDDSLNLYLQKFSGSTKPVVAFISVEAVDEEGISHLLVHEKHWKASYKKQCLPFTDTFRDILNKKQISRFLKDDALSLDFVIVLSDRQLKSEIEHRELFPRNVPSCMENVWALGSRLFMLYKPDGPFTDVTLSCDVGEFSQFIKGTYRVHKAIVFARSPVLADMVKTRKLLLIEDIDHITLDKLLEYIYSSFFYDYCWKELFACGHRFEIPSLRQRCKLHMLENLSKETAVEVLTLADTYVDECLSTAATDFICKYSEEILEREEWNELTRSKPDLASKVLALLPKAATDNFKADREKLRSS